MNSPQLLSRATMAHGQINGARKVYRWNPYDTAHEQNKAIEGLKSQPLQTQLPRAIWLNYF